MPLVARKFNLPELNAFLAGSIGAGTKLTQPENGAALYLHGKTLIFSTPSVTVTFVASPANGQIPLTIPTLLSQIDTQTSHAVKGGLSGGRLTLVLAAGGTLVLTKDGTANPLLGFDTSKDMTGKPVAITGGSAPTFVSLSPDTSSNNHVLVTNE